VNCFTLRSTVTRGTVNLWCPYANANSGLTICSVDIISDDAVRLTASSNGGRLHRQVGRFLSLEDAVDVIGLPQDTSTGRRTNHIAVGLMVDVVGLDCSAAPPYPGHPALSAAQKGAVNRFGTLAQLDVCVVIQS